MDWLARHRSKEMGTRNAQWDDQTDTKPGVSLKNNTSKVKLVLIVVVNLYFAAHTIFHSQFQFNSKKTGSPERH